jgi:hypothetical protein
MLLVLFTGLLWLLGLMCSRDRRRYVMNLSQQSMDAIGVLLHGPAIRDHGERQEPQHLSRGKW